MKKTALEILVIVLISFTYPTQPKNVDLPIDQEVKTEVSEREQRLQANSNSDNQNIHSTTTEVTESSSNSKPALGQTKAPEVVIDSNIVTETGEKYPLRTYKPLLSPNDPSYNQWWVQSINLNDAWDTSIGPNQTTLAIIDSGFALEHEEFDGRWFVNAGEQGSAANENPSDLNCTDLSLPLTEACNNIDDDADGINDNEPAIATTIENPSFLNCSDQALSLDKSCNLVDDDNNGYIDDWRGWDFINSDRSVQAGEMNPTGSGTRHGSYVAGAAAATGNNNAGMAGVDWNTKILPLQALDDDSFGHTLSVARSVRYAAEMGADVISISLGSSFEDNYLRQAVSEAIAAGSVVVAAVGNGDEFGVACECITYPANYPEVVAVGALNASNSPADFSNFGKNLDIMAPGVSIYTTDWSQANPTSDYASVSGTSLATPIVSGLLTRMRSYQPDASGQQMVAALQEYADRLTLSTNQIRSDTLGYGKILADQAMQRVTSILNLEQKTSFSSISYGSNYHPVGSNEFSYDCSQDGLQPTSPIYTMSKNALRLFTTSELERYELEDEGYSSSVLAYTCLTLPDDTANTVRAINPHREFFNESLKD